jgi:tetratricopeptide (TPR) repeat protein
MHDSTAGGTLLTSARAHARRGEWGAVLDLLGVEPVHGLDPELILVLAEAGLRTGRLALAQALLGPLLPALERQGNTPAQRRAVNMLGAAAFELGLMDEAEGQFNSALALANGAGDHLTIGRATNNLGMIAHIHGQYDRALSHYQLAVPAYQRLGFRAGLAETHHNMALALRELGRLDEADRQERRAIEFAREAGDSRLLAMAQVGRADISLRRGEPAVAEAGARQGAERYAGIPDALGEADALRLAGSARTALGSLAGARQALDRAVELAVLHGSALIEAEARAARARLAARESAWDEARADTERAAALYAGLGADREHRAVLAWLAEAVPR